MLKCRRSLLRFTIVAIAMSLCAFSLRADEDSTPDSEKTPDTLTIGSEAPLLDIEHWFSPGEDGMKKIGDFEQDKIYVVEFWATWCGPCISSMPHLAEVQERHTDDGVQVVSITREDKPLVEKFLKREVRSRRGVKAKKEDEGKDESDELAEKQTYADLTSAYCLAADPDESSHDAYMKAAAQNGIPASFIVGKSGLIEWIGHPMTIDKPLQDIIEDKWDRRAFGDEFKAKQAFALLFSKARRLAGKKEFDDAIKLLAEAKETATGRNQQMAEFYHRSIYSQKLQYMSKNGETDEALKLVEADIKDAKESEVIQLQTVRFDMLLQAKRNDEATSVLADLIDDLDSRALNAIAWSVYERAEKNMDDVTPDLLTAATKAAEAAVEETPKQAPILDTLSHLVHLQGDIERAIELQTQAVEFAGNSYPGIKEFLQQLKKEVAVSAENTED